MIVVDAGVVVTVLVDDRADGWFARDRLRRESLARPGASLAPAPALRVIGELAALRLQRAPHRPLLPRCWELLENLTTSDAA